MAVTLEVTPANATPFPVALRAFGYMTDGRPLVVVPEHSGAIVRDFHLYQGDVARTTWTKKITLTLTENVRVCSMVVDGSNNVHLIFVRENGGGASQVVQYVRWDYTSGTNTFTQGVNQLTGASFGPANVDVVESIDITILTGTVPAVTYQWIDANNKRHVDLGVRRSSDNTWFTQRVRDQTASITPPARRNQCVLSADRVVEADGTVQVLHVYHIHDLVSGVAVENYIFRKVFIHPSTGAFTGGTVIRTGALDSAVGAMLWNTNSRKWVFVAAGPFAAHYARVDTTLATPVDYTSPGHTLTDGGLNTGLAYFGFSLALADPIISCTAVGINGVRRSVSCQIIPRTARGFLEGRPQQPIYLDGLNENYWLSAGGYRSSTQIVDLLVWSDTRDRFEHQWNVSPNPNHTVTVVTPAAGATVTTDIPLLELSFSTPAVAPLAVLTGEVELSRDVTFGTVDRIIPFVDKPDDPFLALPLRTRVWSGTAFSGTSETPRRLSVVTSLGNQLVQGTWYARGRFIDTFDVRGSWSPTVSFAVTHPPRAAQMKPTGEAWRLYSALGVGLTWVFDDTSSPDNQTAYQIIVERNDTLQLVHDTGKVSQSGIAVGAETSATVVLAATLKEVQLRWKIRVWDSDDVVGAYSDYNLFRVGDAPVVTVTAPTEGGSVTTPAPTITWTLATGSARSQSQYRVIFREAGATVHDSGLVSSQATTYTPSLAILENGGTYTVEVILVDSGGFQASDTNTFSVSYTVPAEPTFAVDATNYDPAGYVLVDWTATTADAEFVAWRVYRRDVETGVVVLLDEIIDVNTRTFKDYLAPSGHEHEYAVTETVLRFGVLLENSREATFPTHAVTPVSDNYWLIHPDDETMTVMLHNVTEEQFSEEYEQETMNLIGRGRKTDYGTRFGFTGSLTVQLYDVSGSTARQQRLSLEALKAELRELYLRNPFGDVWQVTAGDITFGRTPGVGRREFGVVTIPYVEVT